MSDEVPKYSTPFIGNGFVRAQDGTQLPARCLDGVTSAIYQHYAMNPELLSGEGLGGDLSATFDAYFGFAQVHDQVSMNLFQRNTELMGEPSNNVDDLRAVIAIPAVVFQEVDTLRDAMYCVSRLEFDTHEYEVVVDFNSTSGPNCGVTVDDLDRFQRIQLMALACQEVFDIPLRTFVNHYNAAEPMIGGIRADLWGSVAYDLYARGRVDDIPVISWDVDMAYVSPNFLQEVTTAFEADIYDIIAPTLKWATVRELGKESMLNKMLMYQSTLDHARSLRLDKPWTPDGNTALSLNSYCASGGFNRGAKLGEMGDLVWRMRLNRQVRNKIKEEDIDGDIWLEDAVIASNPRRLIEAMSLGYSPYFAWDQSLIKFGANDELRVRETDLQKVEAIAAEKWQEWIIQMTPTYARVIAKELGKEDTTDYINSMLEFLGIEGLLLTQDMIFKATE